MFRFSTKFLNTPHFSFNFIGTAHHNPNDLYLLDDKLASILESWLENGVLSKSALILTSNHGQLKVSLFIALSLQLKECLAFYSSFISRTS